MLLLHVFVIAVMLVVSMGPPAQAQKAKPAARKTASEQPKPAEQLFYDAFEAYKAERFQDAIGLFEKGLRQVPTNALAAFYLGEAYAKTGNPAKAQEWYAASLAADPQSEVAAQARERLAAAQRGAAAPPPPAAHAGPSFEETLAFIREKLSLHGRCEETSKIDRWSYDVDAMDVSSSNVSIHRRTIVTDYQERSHTVWRHNYTFSISDISRIVLAQGKKCNNAVGIGFICKNTNKCIKEEGTVAKKLGGIGESLPPYSKDKEYFVINDHSQAEKLLKAFQHLFTLRGWQEKKDLF
jgi:tetratricopeptide (TPR) repeat protein